MKLIATQIDRKADWMSVEFELPNGTTIYAEKHGFDDYKNVSIAYAGDTDYTTTTWDDLKAEEQTAIEAAFQKIG